MFNAPLPAIEDLPSTAQLRRSTLASAAVALVLLVTVLLPAEYAIDLTQIGRVLGLTQMGEIKRQLAQEEAADATRAVGLGAIEQRMIALEEQMRRLEPLLVLAQAPRPLAAAPAPTPAPAPAASPAVASPAQPAAPRTAGRSDETQITLRPDQGIEVKLRMRQGGQARYSWAATGGAINFDAHGEPPNAARGFYHGYGTGRGVTADQGTLTAAFDGTHGWFFRNRSGRTVTVTLRTEGDYEAVIRP